MIEVVGGSSQSSRGRMPTGLRAIQAKGNQVLLENGRWYTDWVMGQHGAIYGYAPDWWVSALSDAAALGQVTSIGCHDERIVAEMIAEFYPDIEAVRFMCTGSDPCAAAAKLARAVTGREKLLVYGYHGTNQAFCTPPARAAIDMRRGTLPGDRVAFIPLPWMSSEPTIDNQTAAVVVEIPSDTGDGDSGMWLTELFEKAHAFGALVVLDEVKTGFRYTRGGAAGYYGLQGMVDLYCFGKTLGNGYPVSCLAGERDILRELTNGVHFSGTFFGEPLGLALAKATLHQMLVDPPWDYLYDMGEYLQEHAADFFEDIHHLTGHLTRPVLSGDKETIASFVRLQFERGNIIAQSPWYVTRATTSESIYNL